MTRRVVVLAAALCVLGLAAPVQAAPDPAGGPVRDRSDATQVFNRDVLYLDGVTLREPDAGTDPSETLFNVAGINLGLTWGQWQQAGGSAAAVEREGSGETEVALKLSGLVPGGVYSVFWGTLDPDSEHPGCPGVERTLPLVSTHGKAGPDASSFVAGSNGSARYAGRAPAGLLDAGQTFFTVIYQFDGEPDHPFPNRGERLTSGGEFGCRSSFGEDAMRQLIILMRS